MLFGGFAPGELELRKRRNGRRRLRGRFPYKRKAVLSDGGRNGGKPKKEQFMPGAFIYRLSLPPQDGDIHLLFGHDYDKPLASRATQTLTFDDTEEALNFEAEITPEIADTTHGRDALALIESGLSVGISPGFRIPPPRAVPANQAEKVEQEAYDPSRDMYGALIRSIFAALLYELSIVTAPAYKDASVQTNDDNQPVDANGDGIDDNTGQPITARSWEITESGLAIPKPHTLARWRL